MKWRVSKKVLLRTPGGYWQARDGGYLRIYDRAMARLNKRVHLVLRIRKKEHERQRAEHEALFSQTDELIESLST